MMKVFVVDVGSFEITEKMASELDKMDIFSQREWLIQQIRGGFCDIDQVIEI